MFLKNIFNIFISLFIFIITLEISARIDDKLKFEAPFFGSYTSERLRDNDSEGVTYNVPNSHFEKWRINNFGFRGPDIVLEKPKGVTRIVCMGTSETFGLYESPGDEWPMQLSKILEKNEGYEIINTSVAGMPLNQFVPYIKKYVLMLQPDVFILYLNPFSHAVGVEKFKKRQSENTKFKNTKNKRITLEKINQSLRILPKIILALKNVLPDKILKWKRLNSLKKQLNSLESRRLKNKDPIDVIPTESIDWFEKELDELINFLYDNDVKVILSSYPSLISAENIDEYFDIFLDHRRFYIELSLQGIIDASNKFNEVVQRVANNHKTEFVDNNKIIPKNTQYFADNVHYTNKGAKLVAENFAKHIIESKCKEKNQK